ncbi:phosphotransferase family protein [Mycolicibacterium litorale]|uniref:phosphotransferase family protein n=1 Tax=Mycolicibacterium litorale TaxID=758802 RepID=UPI003CFA05A6
MADNGTALSGSLHAELIAGGRSNRTFALTDGERRWVLRTPPRTGRTPSAHDMAREFRVTAALRDTDVPVPPACALHEDESLIGGPFVITEYVAGRSVQTRDELEALDTTVIGELATALVSTLAALHRVDHVAVGLGTFGRPDGYFARQLRRWSGQWGLVGDPALGGLARCVITKLSSTAPGQRHTAIVHGDYRVDNTILEFVGRGPRVAAVVDWELSTIGDPVADVAMMCAYRDPAFDLIVGAPSAWTSSALPTIDEMAASYETAGGVPLDNWESHLALAYFKIAVIAAGIDYRRASGSGSGVGFDTAGAAVEPYLSRAWTMLGGSR